MAPQLRAPRLLKPLDISRVVIDRRPDGRFDGRYRHRQAYFAQAFDARRKRHWWEWGDSYGEAAKLLREWGDGNNVIFSPEALSVLAPRPAPSDGARVTRSRGDLAVSVWLESLLNSQAAAIPEVRGWRRVRF